LIFESKFTILNAGAGFLPVPLVYLLYGDDENGKWWYRKIQYGMNTYKYCRYTVCSFLTIEKIIREVEEKEEVTVVVQQDTIITV
jgi:hypothetical protein